MEYPVEGQLKEWLEQDGRYDLVDAKTIEADPDEVARLEEECSKHHPHYPAEHVKAWALFSIATRKKLTKEEQRAIGPDAANGISRVAAAGEATVREFRALKGAFDLQHEKLSTVESAVKVAQLGIVQALEEQSVTVRQAIGQQFDGLRDTIQTFIVDFRKSKAEEQAAEEVYRAELARVERRRHAWLWVWRVLVLLTILAVLAMRAYSEPEPPTNTVQADDVVHALVLRPPIFAQFTVTASHTQWFNGTNWVSVTSGNPFPITCISGCGAAASFTDNSAFTVGGTAINVIGAYFTSGAAPACATGNGCRLRADSSSFLMVNCQVGCSGSSFSDNTAFTAGTTSIGITGGWYSTSPTNCTSGNACAPQLSQDRKLFVQAFQGTSPWVVSASGNFGVTQQTSPWVDNLTQVAGVALGATAVVNYGSTPAATAVPGVNAFVTNTVTVSGTVTANQGGAPWSVVGTLTDNNATPAANNVGVLPCRADTNSRAVTVTDQVLLSCDANDLLRVSLKDTPANTNNLNVNIAATAVTQPVSGTVTANAGTGQFNVTCTAANCPVNVAQFGGNAVVTGTGASGTGIPRVTVSNDSSILGTKTNNNAAPGATNFGDLPAIANAATQTWTEGDQVAESVDLSGRQRVRGTISDNGAAATSDLEGVAPSIYQTDYLNGTAATQGRNGAVTQGTDGLLWTAQLPAIRPASYHASASFAGSSTTFAAHLPGNATNTVLVTKIMFSCTQTTAGNLTVTVNKTSAASSGGTAATMTAVPDDSNYAGASSVAQSFTGTGPTPGTPVGQVDAYKLGCMATGTATPNDIYILNLRQKPIVLRGTAQTLEIGVGSATTGGNYTTTFEWIETKTITP